MAAVPADSFRGPASPAPLMPLCVHVVGMGERDRNESGQFADRIPPESVLDVFANREDFAHPLTAQDVADSLDIARRTAHNKLNALEESDQLATRKVGARGRVWWVPINENDLVAGADVLPDSRESRERREEPAESDEVVDTASDSGRREPATAPADEAGRDSAGLEDALAALDTSDRRRDAVRACVAYLREAGTASKSDFQREVYPDHPAGLQSEGGWWNKIGLELLKAVAVDSPTIHPPDGEGAHTWEYAGDDR